MAEPRADMDADFMPQTLHNSLLERAPRILAFDAEAYFPEWQSAVRRSFKQLLGLMPPKGELAVEVLTEAVVERIGNMGRHRAVRLVFVAEPHVRVRCELLLPMEEEGPLAAMICLGERQVGMEALRRGYGALVMEMRGCGERSDTRNGECQHAALVALLVGRTMMGERVWDVVRAVDVLVERFPEVDAARIGVMGCGLAGTVAFYAGAFDARIAAVMADGGVCGYRESIGKRAHGSEAYIPNVMHYFEMSDLAGLIVPRPLVVGAREGDALFPLTGVRACFAEMAEVYRLQGVEGRCALALDANEGMWAGFERIVSGTP